ncbi:MAG: amidohydrolase, partial [Dehalococcoidia bacterium]
MDADDRVVEALLVDGDRIAAVGSEAELRGEAGSGVRIVDLGGRTLMPGFIDGHGHFPGAGIFAIHADLNSPPIGGVERIADIVSIFASRAANARRGSWILGLGYDDSLLAEGRHPTRSDLDLVSTEHPIAAIHISAHLAVVNSRALSLLGIDRESRDPEGGVIRRDPSSGEPTGVLEETAAGAVIDRLQRPSFLDSIRVLRAAGKIYARAGVTTAQNGLASERQVRALNLASRLGLVPLRLVLWPDEKLADDLLRGTVRLSSYDPEWLRIGAMKLVADGSIQGYTGYLGEPYFVVPGEDPGYRGY